MLQVTHGVQGPEESTENVLEIQELYRYEVEPLQVAPLQALEEAHHGLVIRAQRTLDAQVLQVLLL